MLLDSSNFVRWDTVDSLFFPESFLELQHESNDFMVHIIVGCFELVTMSTIILLMADFGNAFLEYDSGTWEAYSG